MSVQQLTIKANDVPIILRDVKEGKTKRYDMFLAKFGNPATQNEFIVEALQGLKDCVSILRKEFDSVVATILKMKWVDRGKDVVPLYQSLVVHIVAAHSNYLMACVIMILKSFTPEPLPAGCDEAQGKLINAQKEKNFIHLHNLLKSICSIAPMTNHVLVEQMPRCQPFMKQSTEQQRCYYKNLLTVTSYLPSIRSAVLGVIIDRLISLDVLSPRGAIQEAEETAAETQMFSMDIRDVGNVYSDSMAHPEADRLDVLMGLLLDYIQSVCYLKGELQWDPCKILFRDLLNVFDRVVVKTYASSHAQFFMFYICSFRDLLTVGFLDYLWKRVQNPNLGMVFRKASAAYIASFMARAKFVSISQVKDCLDIMVAWIHSYIKNSSDSVQMDVDRHGTFYSVCQAVFYVFIFRHKELLAPGAGIKHCKGYNFQTIVTCRLNPLRFCLPIITSTFSSISRIHQLAFCDTVLEKNRRLQLPVANTKPVCTSETNPLDSFFPFDPYELSRSRVYFDKLYQEFEGNIVDAENDDEEDDEDQLYDNEEDDKMEMAFSPSSLAKTPDLMMYGTSPGFQHY